MSNFQNIDTTNWSLRRLAGAKIAGAAMLTFLAGCGGTQLSPESAATPVSVHAAEASPQIAMISLSDETTNSVTARLKHTGAQPSEADHHPSHSGHSSSASEPEAKPQNAMYTCPMHPEIKQAKPGNCSICGMNLVPI